MVIFILVPGGTTNRYLRLSMGYFKRKISPSQSELLRRLYGKVTTREARGRGFKSQPKDILREYFGTGWNIDLVPKEALGTS